MKKAGNKRLVYFLGFLVVVLPVVVGILVWQLLPGCDADDKNGAKMDSNTGDIQTTTPTNNKGTTTDDPFENGPWKNLRLPNTVMPNHYEVTLFPDFYDKHETFYGNVTMELRVKSHTSIIMVHIKYLNISATVLSSKANFSDSIPIKKTFEYPPNEFWVTETVTPLSPNSTVYLKMTFSGSLTRSIVGFYKSSYINALTNTSR